MNKIEQLIAKNCPDGVEFKPLGEVCEILDNKRKPITKSDRFSGEFPYYGANGIQDYVNDYIFDGTYLLMGEDGSVINENRNPILSWATGKFWANNHVHILGETEISKLRFVYFYLSTVDVSELVHGNIPKINQGDLKSIKIPVPPIQVQEEIVKILDKFTELEAELEAELAAREKQYSHYRDALLSFDDSTPDSKPPVEWKNIKDIVNDSFWIMPATPGYVPDGIPYITSKNVKNGKISFEDTKFITKKDFYEISKNRPILPNDILIGMIGTLGENAIVSENDGDFYGQNMFLLRLNKDVILTKYFYYFFNSQKIKKYLQEIKNNSSQGYLKTNHIENIKIPIPPLAEQERIVAILDKFDSLVNDISVGLPAEIAARRKQYEYYREKLLTFPKAE